MAFLQVNRRYERLVEQQGLTTAGYFLDIPSVIFCGHPDRNVARVQLGSGSTALVALLKREHRVAWKDRLGNAIGGFGLVSKSRREAIFLRTVQQAGVCCPDWIAVGEDDRGRAFLLLRELTGTVDLRLFLHEHRKAAASERRRFARGLGQALAGLHNAGFDHPDLYSKHILVNIADGGIHFVDWQRSRQRRHVTWRRRCRDLAALEATLAGDVATVRERIACLRAYLRQFRPGGSTRRLSLRSRALAIRRRADRLLRQRRIRELAQVPAEKHAQRLIWQDGEALCLTLDFHADLAGRIPDWLRLGNAPARPRSWETHTWVDVPEARRALLVYRRQRRLLSALWAWLRRRSVSSPEVRRAGLLFRLQRYGMHVPRLLAFGQRYVTRFQVDSFLLLEPPPGAVALCDWLAEHSTDLGQRRQIIREAGAQLRRLHSLDCYLGGQPSFAVVQPDQHGAANIVLASSTGLSSRRRSSNWEVWKDLSAFHSELLSTGIGRTDRMRFLLSYLGLRKSCAAAKRMALNLRNLRTLKRVSVICNLQFAICNLQFPLLRRRLLPDAKARAQGALP